MIHKNLAIYLNDHLAGSSTGVELLANLAAMYPGTEVGKMAAQLEVEVTEDRKTLEDFMEQVHVNRRHPIQAVGWLAEKAVQLKMRVNDPATGAFRMFVSLETISLGVEGKRLLWVALETASRDDPSLRGPDYPLLQRRAEDQRSRLESARRSATQPALVGTG
jgi:hypothetical protein